MKRAFDVMGGLIGIILLGPALLAICVLVRLRMGGPVLFRQTRIGRYGRPFVLYKFRTMSASSSAEAGRFEPGNLKRITPLGRVVRRWKLDELPQFFNVLKGDMSLVGPRPEVAKWVEAYPDRWAAIHRVRPGITDPASVLYRCEEAVLASAGDPEETYRDIILPRKLSLYEEYIRDANVFTDIAILARTLATVVKP